MDSQTKAFSQALAKAISKAAFNQLGPSFQFPEAEAAIPPHHLASVEAISKDTI